MDTSSKMPFNHFVKIIINYITYGGSLREIFFLKNLSILTWSDLTPNLTYANLGNAIGNTPKRHRYLSTKWSTPYFSINFMVFD
jgi:hypothetical protein